MSPAVDLPHVSGAAPGLAAEGPRWSVSHPFSSPVSVVAAGVALLSTLLRIWTLFISQRDLKGRQGLKSFGTKWAHWSRGDSLIPPRPEWNHSGI